VTDDAAEPRRDVKKGRLPQWKPSLFLSATQPNDEKSKTRSAGRTAEGTLPSFRLIPSPSLGRFGAIGVFEAKLNIGYGIASGTDRAGM
jgi:hypothetical protein